MRILTFHSYVTQLSISLMQYARGVNLKRIEKYQAYIACRVQR